MDKNMDIKELKREMIECYGLKCWINEIWIPTRRNYITYHHIIEKRNGGLTEWENGALISRHSHEYLNYLDMKYPHIYKALNGLFYELNKTYSPPQEDYYEEVNHILRKIK